VCASQPHKQTTSSIIGASKTKRPSQSALISSTESERAKETNVTHHKQNKQRF
jgi:hypothetical protein